MEEPQDAHLTEENPDIVLPEEKTQPEPIPEPIVVTETTQTVEDQPQTEPVGWVNQEEIPSNVL